MAQPERLTTPLEVYDVLLSSSPPKAVLARLAHASIRTTGVQTALRRRVAGPAQLDALLDKLSSLGVSFVEIHRQLDLQDDGQVYEVVVDGEYGASLLRYLSWPHQVVPGQTRVRLTAASSDLHEFLRQCTASGASIQQVRRVSTVRPCAPRPK